VRQVPAAQGRQAAGARWTVDPVQGVRDGGAEGQVFHPKGWS
jgi:hypothetical protein